MEKQILLPESLRREISSVFKVGHRTLYNALCYRSNSSKARMLRAAALERGGLIYTGERAPRGYCPNVETRHDQVRGMMYQSFGDRVELQVSRESNVATIIIDNEPVATFDDMTLGTWGDILYSFQKIYNQLCIE